MYLPAHFAERRPEVLRRAIHDHPLGLLVTHDAAGAVANDLPFLFDADPAPLGTLRAHVARANPLWRDTLDASEALVVFQGPQAYVSPGWYPSKRETGKVVPTWNYVMVQARGRLRAVDDKAWVRAFVERLTARHESGRAAPWAPADAPDDFIDAQLGAIVGIEIELTTLVGKWKVSQNRSAADRAGVADGLRAEGSEEAALVAGQVQPDRA